MESTLIINKTGSSQLKSLNYSFQCVSTLETLCFAYGNTLYPLWKQNVSIIETNCFAYRNKESTC